LIEPLRCRLTKTEKARITINATLSKALFVLFVSCVQLKFFPLRSLSENNNKTATIAITIAAATDNSGTRLLSSPFAEAGTGIAVGAGIAGGAEAAVDGTGAGGGVAAVEDAAYDEEDGTGAVDGTDVVGTVGVDFDACPDGK
jgi:hypothetical protein